MKPAALVVAVTLTMTGIAASLPTRHTDGPRRPLAAHALAGAVVYADVRCPAGHLLYLVPGVASRFLIAACGPGVQRATGRGRVMRCDKCQRFYEVIELPGAA